MHGGSFKTPLLALPPDSEIAATYAGVSGGASGVKLHNRTTDCLAASSHGLASMSADAFEEDWQRPPGDILYLQDLLQSLEKSPQHPQTLTPTVATNVAAGKLVTTKKTSTSSRREGNRAGEEEDMAALRVREKQLTVIEKRRRRAQNKCDTVDAAFARSVERRMRAMQHLAHDPPAERLVGQGMTQYVPAALLPDNLLDEDGQLRPGFLPLQPHSVVESHVQQQFLTADPGQQGSSSWARESTSSQAVTAAITDGAGRKLNEPDTLVFLTQLDAGGAPEGAQVTRTSGVGIDSQQTSSSAGNEDNELTSLHTGSSRRQANTRRNAPDLPGGKGKGTLSEADDGDNDDDEEDAEDWMRPSNLTAENEDRWRKLGYHAVVVGGDCQYGGGSKRAVGRRAYNASPTQPESSSSPNAASVTRAGGLVGACRHPSGAAASSSSKNAILHQHGSNSAFSYSSQATAQTDASWRWTTLAPLPPVCLIQRRLPEEDMTVTELRNRQSAKPPTRTGSRRRLAADSGAGRSWKTRAK